MTDIKVEYNTGIHKGFICSPCICWKCIYVGRYTTLYDVTYMLRICLVFRIRRTLELMPLPPLVSSDIDTDLRGKSNFSQIVWKQQKETKCSTLMFNIKNYRSEYLKVTSLYLHYSNETRVPLDVSQMLLVTNTQINNRMVKLYPHYSLDSNLQFWKNLHLSFGKKSCRAFSHLNYITYRIYKKKKKNPMKFTTSGSGLLRVTLFHSVQWKAARYLLWTTVVLLFQPDEPECRSHRSH